MGLLSWFKRHTPPADAPFIQEPFIHIPARDTFAFFSKSPSTRYTIAWLDASDSDGGGARSSGMGSYFLLDGPNIIAEGQLERPHDGRVADNGTFVLNDWLFSSGLNGVFHAFRADGSNILSKRFEANLYNNGLSQDGSLAVCQTCNAPSADSSILALFDLHSGREVAQWVPPSGWAKSYEFIDHGSRIRLCYGDGAGFSYALNGDFTERQKWIDHGLAKGDLRIIQEIVTSSDTVAAPDRVERLLASIDVALATIKDEHSRALAFRYQGMCFEAKGDSHQALSSYEKALELDPKVGVKRRADNVRKQIK